MRGLVTAFTFLTTLPAPGYRFRSGDLARARPWLALVGAVLGALLAAAHYGLRLVFPPLLTAVLVVAAWALLTGALHLDGVADSSDGMLAAATRERRRQIMRDPRVGAFGVVGVVLVLLAKVAALAALPPDAWTVLPLAAALARWAVLPVAAAGEPGGQQQRSVGAGLGGQLMAGLNTGNIAAAGLLPAALIVLNGWRGLAAAAAAVLTATVVATVACRRLGGVNGDVLGLTVEAVELAALAMLVADIGVAPWSVAGVAW